MKRPKKIRCIIVDGNSVYIRKKIPGQVKLFKKSFGPVSDPDSWADAKSELRQMEDQLEKGKFKREDDSQRILVPAAIDLFIEKHGNTWKHQLVPVKKAFESTYLDELTYLKLKTYRETRSESLILRHGIAKPVEQSTINRELTGLSSLYESFKVWMEEQEIRPLDMPKNNPVKMLRKILGKKGGWHNESENRRTRILSEDELGCFFEFAPERLRRICIGALNTALRKNDLLALSQQNREGETLRGVQSKVGNIYVLPENDNMRRLFNTSDRTLFDDTNFRGDFEGTRAAVIEKLSCPWFVFKDFRRTALRKVWEMTKDPLLTRDLAGHKDFKTTQIYLGLTDGEVKQTGEILQKAFTFEVLERGEEAV